MQAGANLQEQENAFLRSLAAMSKYSKSLDIEVRD